MLSVPTEISVRTNLTKLTTRVEYFFERSVDKLTVYICEEFETDQNFFQNILV